MDTQPERAGTHRQSALMKSSRRSTFLARPLDQNEPIVENPSNTPERNQELKEEYEKAKALNRTLGTVVNTLDKTKEQISSFNDTLDRTNGLLDIWMGILENTEKTKSLMENPNWHGTSALVHFLFLLLYPY